MCDAFVDLLPEPIANRQDGLVVPDTGLVFLVELPMGYGQEEPFVAVASLAEVHRLLEGGHPRACGGRGAAPPDDRVKIVFGTDGWRAGIADEYTFDAVRVCAQSVAECA